MRILQVLKNKTIYETIVRYALGLIMLPYGITKILRTQFIVFPFHNWTLPLKDVSGATLTWAFLGYSPWFTVMLGLLEAIPSILLLFRKTRLLGTILLLPITLNVFLINIALDLWPGTQLISGILVLLNLILLVFHHKLLIEFFYKILDLLQAGNKYLKLEWVINLLLIGFVTFVISSNLFNYIDQRNFLTGDWYNDKPHYWIQGKDFSKSVNGSSNPILFKNDNKFYFHPNNSLIQIKNDIAKPSRWKYSLDSTSKFLSIYNEKDSSIRTSSNYYLINEDTIIWKIEADSTVKLIKKRL